MNESGWWDLNPRPLAPEASALPSCATARDSKFYRLFSRLAQVTHSRRVPNEALYQAEPQPVMASLFTRNWHDVHAILWAAPGLAWPSVPVLFSGGL
jgi:hypothetical protein